MIPVLNFFLTVGRYLLAVVNSLLYGKFRAVSLALVHSVSSVHSDRISGQNFNTANTLIQNAVNLLFAAVYHDIHY